MITNRFLLNGIEIPNDVKTKIENMLPPSDQGRLASTSHSFYKHEFDTQLFFNARIRKKCELVQKLLNHVIRGEQREADHMLYEDPGILLERGMVIDFVGRKIEGTALQMALGAGDLRHHDKEEGMAEMIERHFKSLPNWEKIITAQIAEQFPEGWEKKNKEKINSDLTALRIVFNQIKNATKKTQCEEAIQVFNHYLMEQKKEIISEGKYFNVEILIVAVRLFDANYEYVGNRWDSFKNVTSWRKIIGLIQANLTAPYAQGFCQGYYYLVEKGKQLKRTLRFPDGRFYYPDANSNYRLGQEFAVNLSIGQVVEDAFWIGPAANYFTEYVNKTEKAFEQMKLKYVNHTEQRCCNIMCNII